MSSDAQPSPADQQRAKAARRQRAPKPDRSGRSDKAAPPRQRRPALAALAVALIVGGALVAGLLAVRLDSRETYYAAARDIEAGQVITEGDLKKVSVAVDGMNLIPEDQVGAVVNGAVYARVPIRVDTLIGTQMLTDDEPVEDDYALVVVPLTAKTTPSSQLRTGDLVSVVRISGGDQEPAVLTEALVRAVTQGASTDDLSSPSAGTLTLAVPREAALVVIDAAGTDRAGIALLERSAPSDTRLRALDTEPVPGVGTPSASASADPAS